MIYAPVCIPTLNRYEHLKKCLESLSSCTWADKTEVYVALDYPPKDKWDKYAPGWEKNKDFLDSCGDMGFKKLHVIHRDHNYGTWNYGDEGNSRCLQQLIKSKYDRYIFTEDDNVFSPCFLDYMNKGLELFKDDDKVLSISGYKLGISSQLLYEDNSFVRIGMDYNGWGIGLWTKKENSLPVLDYKWYRSNLKISTMRRLVSSFGIGPLTQLINLSCNCKHPRAVVDVNFWTYLAVSERQQIQPRISLVQNIGFDGSGSSMPDCTGQDWCNPNLHPISKEQFFDFVGDGYEHYDENQHIYTKGKYYKSDAAYIYILLKKIVKLLLHW